MNTFLSIVKTREFAIGAFVGSVIATVVLREVNKRVYK